MRSLSPAIWLVAWLPLARLWQQTKAHHLLHPTEKPEPLDKAYRAANARDPARLSAECVLLALAASNVACCPGLAGGQCDAAKQYSARTHHVAQRSASGLRRQHILQKLIPVTKPCTAQEFAQRFQRLLPGYAGDGHDPQAQSERGAHCK